MLGLGLLVALVVHANFFAMFQTLESGGWALLWLMPYRTLFFLLYAFGWLALLRPYDPAGRAGLGFLLWVTAVRDSIDRLLPVASIGGSIVGVRMVGWRGLGAAPVGATVIVEIILTLIVSYIFTAAGLYLLAGASAGEDYQRLLSAFLLSLPVPIATFVLLRYASVFSRVSALLSPLGAESALSQGAAGLDRQLRESLRRRWRLLCAGTLQLLALASGSFEIWFALRIFGHPVGAESALVLESLTQAARHIAFIIPGGLGVQEAGLVLFGQALGVGAEFALAVSMAKRLREVVWGVPSLISWQWVEAWRLRKRLQNA